MKKKSREVNISFRILGLSKGQIDKFRKEVKSSHYGFRVSNLRLEPSVSVVRFELRHRQSYADLLTFLQLNMIKKTSYGIWVSLITDNDTGGVHVPAYVLKLYEKTGGNFDFSFSCG